MSKFCVNCKFCRVNWLGMEYSRCTRDVKRVDYVTGTSDFYYCATSRASGCGPSGKWYETKESVQVSNDPPSTATNNKRGFLEWVKSLFITRA